jgi:hypothetical protein
MLGTNCGRVLSFFFSFFLGAWEGALDTPFTQPSCMLGHILNTATEMLFFGKCQSSKWELLQWFLVAFCGTGVINVGSWLVIPW